MLRDYIVHFIKAPCWIAYCEDEEYMAEIGALEEMACKIKSVTEIRDWIDRAMEIGLDPL
jgi:predicted RNase H-like HicB family nuclease